MFTYNNPDENLVLERDLEGYEYLCYQFEVGDKGTPHYQGYVCFTTKKRFSTLKKKYDDNYHWECRMGTHNDAKHYVSKPHDGCDCSKCEKERKNPTRVEGTFEQFGSDADIPKDESKRGERTDLDLVKKAIDDGATLTDIITNHPNVYARASKWVQEYVNIARETKQVKLLAERINEMPKFAWHKKAHDKLLSQDHRKILWIVGTQGEEGKTLFAKGLIAKYKNRVFVTTAFKAVDIYYLWQPEQDIVVFNLTATTDEYIPYHVFECFKDGIITSTKYVPTTKMNLDVKLCVLSNYTPDTSKLKKNRFDVINL